MNQQLFSVGIRSVMMEYGVSRSVAKTSQFVGPSFGGDIPTKALHSVIRSCSILDTFPKISALITQGARYRVQMGF